MIPRGLRGGSIAALVAATGVAAVVAARMAPASLLTAPERTLVPVSRTDVRLEGSDYPRHATGADDVRVTVRGPARRIVSQYWSIDEFLYAVVPPERVVGVSDNAYIEKASNLLDLMRQFHPRVAADVEQVLRLEPDLVIASETARSDGPSLLRSAGLPVYRMFTSFTTLASIEDHIRLIGYLTGEDARAAAALETFQSTLRRAAARRPPGSPAPRVIVTSGGYAYGAHTVMDDILRAVGAENLAATHGFSGYDRLTDEHLVRWNPEWIVTGANVGDVDGARQRLLSEPAVAATDAARLGHVVVIDNFVFQPLSPLTARLAERLADVFYR